MATFIPNAYTKRKGKSNMWKILFHLSRFLGKIYDVYKFTMRYAS